MKKLLIKLILLGALVLPAIVANLLHNFAGESMLITSAIEKQSGNSGVLYGKAYSDRTKKYKFYALRQANATILAVGTSRVMQFQGKSFRETFYNSGGVVSKLHEVKFLLDQLTSENVHPSKIILGLDQYFFNQKWENIAIRSDEVSKSLSDFQSELFGPEIYQAPVLKILTDMVEGKINFSKWNWENIGLNAIQNGSGFRPDGSRDYGSKKSDDSAENHFEQTMKRVKQGTERFEWGGSVNPAAIETLRAIVSYCKEHQIKIYLFLPPYAPYVYQSMMSTPNYRYMQEITPEVVKLVDNKTSFFYDFTTVNSFSDSDFIDGFHGGERVYAYIAEVIKRDF